MMWIELILHELINEDIFIILFQYAAGVVTYPFTLVSHLMIVNHVG